MAKKLIAEPILSSLEPKLKERVFRLKKRGVTPALAIIWVGRHKPSEIFVAKKMAKAKQLGIKTHLWHPQETSSTKLKQKVTEFSNNPKISGILIQLPLPKELNADEAISEIRPEKDVDGLKDQSFYKVPTVKGIMTLIATVTEVKGKQVAIVGKGKLVGKPLAEEMKAAGAAKVIIIDKSTKNPAKLARSADILVSATGKKRLVDKNWVKEGAVVIDAAGGDVDSESVNLKAGFLTPTKGAVGPLTVYFLLENTVQSAEKSLEFD